MTPQETASVAARYLAFAQLYGDMIPYSGLTEVEKDEASSIGARRFTEDIGSNADNLYRMPDVSWESVKAVYAKLNAVLSRAPEDYAEYVANVEPTLSQSFNFETTQLLLLQCIQMCPSSIRRVHVHHGQGPARILCWLS